MRAQVDPENVVVKVDGHRPTTERKDAAGSRGRCMAEVSRGNRLARRGVGSGRGHNAGAWGRAAASRHPARVPSALPGAAWHTGFDAQSHPRTARRQPVARLNRIRSDGPESAAPGLRRPSPRSARRGVHRTPFAVGRGDLPRGAGEAGLATTLGPEVGAFGSVVHLWLERAQHVPTGRHHPRFSGAYRA
jgi:hypothetical protein